MILLKGKGEWSEAACDFWNYSPIYQNYAE